METTIITPELSAAELEKIAVKAAKKVAREAAALELRRSSEAATTLEVSTVVSALAAAYAVHSEKLAALAAAVDGAAAVDKKAHTNRQAAAYRTSVRELDSMLKKTVRIERATNWFAVCADNSQYKNFVTKLSPAMEKLASALCKVANSSGLSGRNDLIAAGKAIDFNGLTVSVEALTDTLDWVQRPGQKACWECSFLVTTASSSATIKCVPVKAAAIRGAVKSVLSGKQ